MKFMSKNIVLLTFLYFIQGLPYGFQARFLPILLRTQGVSLTSLGFFKLLLAPWLCKALWAPLVDRHGTKRQWLLGSILGLVITCAFGSLADQNNLVALCVILFLLNLCAATQDIAVDSLAVAILSSKELGHGNTAQVVGYKIGSVFGGGILVWFLDWIGWIGMFLFLTALYVEALMFVYVSPSLRHVEAKISQKCETQEECLEEEDDVFCDEQFEGADMWHEAPSPVVDEGYSSAPRSEHRSGIHKPSTDARTLNKELSHGEIQDYISTLKEVMSIPGTTWMLVYTLIYKLGEQGSLGMLPLLMVDEGISANDVTFWTGVVGQGTSIAGSVLGGWALSNQKFPCKLLLQQLSLIRMLPLGAQVLIVTVWSWHVMSPYTLFPLAVFMMNLSLLLSGMVTTATFTFMMICSRGATSTSQATHYTCLATVEVFGKLAFMSLVGYFVDLFGYPFMFLVFVFLAFVVVLWLGQCPVELTKAELAATENSCDNSGQFSDVEEGEDERMGDMDSNTRSTPEKHRQDEKQDLHKKKRD